MLLPSLSDHEKLLILHVAHENYASAVALNPRNYIALFSWGYIAHSLAKSFAKLIDSQAAFNLCFEIYGPSLPCTNASKPSLTAIVLKGPP